MSARSVVVLAIACTSLSACAALAPPSRPAQQAAAVARTQTTHELASPTPPETTTEPGAASPQQAVRRFADAYINWTADSVGRDMRALAAASVGQARSALQLAAAQTASDYELKRGGIANRGTVEAVAALPGGANRYVVVTRESTTATNSTGYEGLRPAWHVALATVDRSAQGGWVISGWQPES